MYNQPNSSQNDEKWHQSLFGLIVITLGLNLLSNWIYDKGRDQKDAKYQIRERKRERKHLEDYHNKSTKDAILDEIKTHSEIIAEE